MFAPLHCRNPLTAASTLSALLALAAPAGAVPFDVTAGKSVTATAALGVISPAGLGFGFGDSTAFPVAPLASITDGSYLPEGTYWQSGTVWWDENHSGSAGNIIEIDLGGTFLVSFLSIQGDNNDSYDIHVRDRHGVWSYFVTANPFGDAGMRERAGPFTPFEASGFRIDAGGGDGFYSLAEFRAMGEAIPAPGSLALIALGIAGLGAARRRRA